MAVSGLKKYSKNTLWMLFEKMLRMLLGVMIGILIARFLGPTDFGVYSYVISIAAIIAVGIRLGMDPIVVRNIVNGVERAPQILMASLVTRLMLSLSSVFLVGIVGEISGFQETKYLLVVLSGYVLISFDVLALDYEARVQSKVVVICKIIQVVVSSVLKLFLIINDFDLFFFFVVVFFDYAFLAMLIAFSYFFYSGRRLEFINIKSNVLEISKDSWPLLLTGVSLVVFSNSDKIMIEYFFGAYEVGIYSAGVRFSEAVSMIPVVIASSLFPAILNSKKVSKEEYYSRIQKFYFLMSWLGLAVAVMLMIFSPWLVYLYGGEYRESVSVLLVHSLGIVFIFQWVARGRWVIAENLQKITFVYITLGVFINILLNYYLIGKLGVVGAALATVLTQMSITIILPMFFSRMRYSTLMLLKSFYSWKV